MSTVAAANFLLYITEALRRFVRANPNETFEGDIAALLHAPPTLDQEEVVNAPHVQGTDEEEEDEGDEAGAGVFNLDDNEEDENENEPDAEDGEAVLVQPDLRRYNTMIVDFYEDEHVPSPINDEGIAFVDADIEQNQPPLPIAEVINGDPYVKIGNILLRAGSRKRHRSEFERDDDTSSSQSVDPDARPLKRYRRNIRPIEEKRSHRRHVVIEDAMYKSLEDDLERLQSQQEPSNIRLKFLGEDDLDDAPTPPGSPVAKMEFDFE